MTTGRLFYDDEFNALQAVIDSSERTVKECGMFLFPHLKPESAYARMKKCLESGADERLTFGQIVALCKFCCKFDALYWMADELTHSRPIPVAPKDRQAALMLDFNEHVDRLDRIRKELSNLGAMPGGLKSVA
jgi:hypothetical protein